MSDKSGIGEQETNQLSVKTTGINASSANKKDTNLTTAQSNQSLETFLTLLKIEQGTAHFTQKKHFTFLNKPIVSKGVLKVYQTRVIWQVNSPVFSKLLIIDNQVLQLVTANDKNTPEQYQEVASHSSIEALIRAVFTGEINSTQWNIAFDEQQCLQLAPKDLVLSQAIKGINVCVPSNPKQRFITLEDAQNNLTDIELNIITNQLSDEDIREFNSN
ncbi:hypothetical protein [Colwellia sp. E2M01]|uniref:hypothetical protein n=1 Tax=Colwellia sp. E2M01 TaxID=2841561 RepID=UPI001C088DC3|nr:hypothetical protein [Colwellia sp. E2M01]MBU2871623.1 hypothetical protein [Colwellia sp. E2M01]